MNRISKLAVSMAATAAFLISSGTRAQAGAPPINGNINFPSGFLTFDTGNIGSARAINNFSNAVAGTATGAYSALSNAVVSWKPFTFTPPAVSVKPLWTFSTNGVTYSFDATSVVLVFQNSGYLNLRGTGVAHVTGYADTPGNWTLSALLTGGDFTFSATMMSTNAYIPSITNLVQTNGTVTFSWNASAGQSYQVQYSPDLSPTNWHNLGDPVVATGSTITTNDTPAPAPKRFYRVLLQD